MEIKINRKLLPIKAHYFFFFAALGPILPQLNVYGRQLGVSPMVMGYVTAGLPLLWALAKPVVGYIVDYWPNQRKLVFMMLIITMTGSYCGLWFIPTPADQELTDEDHSILEYVYQMNDTVYLQKYEEEDTEFLEKFRCHWSCLNENSFEVYLTNTTYVNAIYVDDVRNTSCSLLHMDFDSEREGDVICTPKPNCNLLCFEDESLNNTVTLNRTKRAVDNMNIDNKVIKDDEYIENGIKIDKTVKPMTDKNNLINNGTSTKKYVEFFKVDNAETTASLARDDTDDNSNDEIITIDIQKETVDPRDKVSNLIINGDVDAGSFYVTVVFWSFVILMCVGTVAFNVANCIGDAVCFDVLGPDNGSAYGAQRAWGTAGYGLTAFLGGWLVDAVSNAGSKDFTPAFVLALIATAVDLLSCTRLELPALSSPDDSGKALREVLKIPRVVVFIIFAVVAGVFDSFIIYYMFWFLEDLAEQTEHIHEIKLIEGIVVAGQSFIGEIVFFALSGKIIERWGYGATMTLSLFCYGVRMALISLIRNPWQLIPIESIMQGPTYALCYSTIVGYAAHVAPEGYSATVQGIVAGMDDGVGFALGSLVGGQLFAWAGGRGAFRVLSVAAAGAAVIHAALFALVTRDKAAEQSSEPPEEGEKMLPVATPEVDTHAIYRDTVVPLTDKSDR